jgi:competence ComEA-like helix-hairpin-helix protein
MALRSFRQFIKDYFTFSRRHRQYLFVLLLLLTGVLAVQAYFRFFPNRTPEKFDAFQEDILAFEKRQRQEKSPAAVKEVPEGMRTETDRPAARWDPVPFDPNDTPDSVWRRLGLPPWMGERIRRYVAAGGKFRKKEDLKKIYGFRPEDYDRLEPWIVLPKDTLPRPAKRNPPPETVIDLNTATAEALIALRGIGEARARAILDYRTRLGGYLHAGQLAEVYGLDSALLASLAPRLTVNAAHWGRININASQPEAMQHPYLDRRMAHLIVNYRTMHGSYQSIQDLKKVEGISADALERVLPYLSVD